MNKRVKTKWIKALESGEYNQAKSMLNNGQGGFCCLGVLCDVYAKEKKIKNYWKKSKNGFANNMETPGHSTGDLPKSVAEWAGLDRGELGLCPIPGSKHALDDTLAALNDSSDTKSFKPIIKVIKEKF